MTKESLPPLLWGNVSSNDVIQFVIQNQVLIKTVNAVAAIKAVLHLGGLWKNDRVPAKIHEGSGTKAKLF